MTAYQNPRSKQLAATTSSDNPQMNCVVAIITDDDSDADTLKDSGTYYPDRRGSSSSGYGCGYESAHHTRAPMIKHIASSSSVCTMDTDNRLGLNGVSSHSQTQLNGGGSSRNGTRTLGGRPYSGSTSGSNSGCVPILLSVPSAGPPRRRHSWICG